MAVAPFDNRAESCPTDVHTWEIFLRSYAQVIGTQATSMVFTVKCLE